MAVKAVPLTSCNQQSRTEDLHVKKGQCSHLPNVGDETDDNSNEFLKRGEKIISKIFRCFIQIDDVLLTDKLFSVTF